VWVWEEARAQVVQVLSSIAAAKDKILYGFVNELLNIHNQQLSSHVPNILSQHGEEILNSIQACQPDLVK